MVIQLTTHIMVYRQQYELAAQFRRPPFGMAMKTSQVFPVCWLNRHISFMVKRFRMMIKHD